MPCFPSLARAEKNPSACRGGGSKSRRGFPPTYRPAKGTKRPLWPPQGKQKGIWPPHGEQKGRYAPVGVRPPPPLRGLSPCEAGQFIPAGFDCRHSQVCKSRNSLSLNSFFQMVLNPQDSATPNTLPACYSEGTTGQPSSSHAISARNNLLAPSVRL